MSEEKRIVLIKPGDILIIANVGIDMSARDVNAIGEGLESVGLATLIFSEDITLDLLDRRSIEVLYEKSQKTSQEAEQSKDEPPIQPEHSDRAEPGA